MLLDSGSTVDLIKTPTWLKDIKESPVGCDISTNGGVVHTKLQGNLPGYGVVWHHPEAITNILSLHRVQEKFGVTYDSANKNSFLVHKPDGVREFRATAKGLYALVDKDPNKTGVQLLQTVKDNMKHFSKQSIEGAKKAKDLYGKVHFPSIPDFKNMVRYSVIKNYPITLEDVDAMEAIFGPNVAALKGKTVQKQSPKVKTPDYMAPPLEVTKLKDKIVLEADVIYVSGIMFWFTMSRKLDFLTIERIADRRTETIAKATTNVLALYKSKALTVRTLCVDAEFGTPAFITSMLRYSVSMNEASAREHAGGIERKTRTLKERVRAGRSQMPFKKIPKVMTSDLVKDVVSWLNRFHNKSSMIPTVGARSLITGVQFDFLLHCQVEFGQYCEVHEDQDIKNSVDKERTVGAIAIKASRNLQGGYRFLNLKTG